MKRAAGVITGALTLLCIGHAAWAWPPNYTGNRSTAILPANETTTSYRMQARGRQVYANYQKYVQQHGDTPESRAAFEGLSPFVQNTYGQKVPVIGVSVSTNTGNVGTNSGGVQSGQELSDFLQHRGAMPADMKQIVQGTKPSVPTPPALTTLKLGDSAVAARSLMDTGKQLLPQWAVRSSDQLRLPTLRLQHFLNFERSIAGSYQRLETGDGAIALKKEGPQGRALITYVPGDGLTFRTEIAAAANRTGREVGFVVSFASQGTGNQGLKVISDRLLVQRDDPNHRYVPAGAASAHTLAVPPSFSDTWGL